jgi:ureidoglycolate lyase
VRLTAMPADARLFEPFGVFIDGPGRPGERRMYSEWAAAVPALQPQFHTNSVSTSPLPVTITRVEKHPHAAQVFLPMRGTRYLVVVMPADAAGRPEIGGARAFVVPGTVGVAYRPGTWHAGMTALDTEAGFAVLMWRGAADDDVFADIPALVVDAGPGGCVHA